MTARQLSRKDSGARELAAMKVGDTVSIKNQHGNTPLKWDNTGIIVEVGAYNKNTVKIDGSGHLTDRNKRFLWPIQTYMEIISKPTPTAGKPAADKTALQQTKAEPRRSARVAKRSQAVTTGRRPSRK